MAEKKELPIRSSAAEYLTFVASTGESDASFEMRYEDENIWLTQKMMAALYDVTKQTISQHINRIYADGELTPEATVKKYLTVQTEEKRQVSRSQDHYNLQRIIAVGFKVNKKIICSQMNILNASYSRFVKFGCRSAGFIRK